MTATATIPVDVTPGAGDRMSAPVPHDFPHPTCCVCRFPVPRWDLAGDEFRPRHASTCVADAGLAKAVER